MSNLHYSQSEDDKDSFWHANQGGCRDDHHIIDEGISRSETISEALVGRVDKEVNTNEVAIPQVSNKVGSSSRI